MQTYSQKQLYNIASDNYALLREYCRKLDEEGYWEGPGDVLGQTIENVLDMYVQTVLLHFALYCKCLGREQLEFISRLTYSDIYGLKDCSQPDQEQIDECEHMFSQPPILLQLCGLRDMTHGSGLFGLFFDALLNIELAMAYLNSVMTGHIASFIHEYYSHIEAFIGKGEGYEAVLNERYIFQKLCNDSLTGSAGALRSCGESFEKYRRTYILSLPEDKSAKAAVNASASDKEEPKEDSVNNSQTTRDEVNKEGSSFEKPETNEGSEDVNSAENVNCPEAAEQPAALKEEPEPTELEKLLAELNALVGLDSVKEEVRSLINLIRVRNLRRQHNMPLMDMSFHMVFTGNPGTGKTTVARLIAGIYKELGVLSKGQLIETDRSGLVAGYVGQTALKVKETVEKAIGGILFIDEAYALASSTQNDFGDEAIETLVKLMEDHRDDLVVIVAGYTREMENFLKSNSGLTSRFNKYIVFDDYSSEELVSILDVMAEKAGYKLSESARYRAAVQISKMDDAARKAFGNARGVRNMFERIVTNQANRLCGIEEPDIEALSLIEEEDVR